MGDSAGETVPCHYCGTAVDVPAERSRFEVFTSHFETEHIRDRPAVSRERASGELAAGSHSRTEGDRDAGN